MKKMSDQQCSSENFSLGVGGPLYQLFVKLHLVKSPLLLFKRRIMIIALLTWLPLLILAVLGGVAIGGVKVPFIYDIDVHVRFILVLSMLLYAEVVAHDRLHVIVEQFQKCNIIMSSDKSRFNKIIHSTVRLRDSVAAEIILIILVYTLGHWISIKYLFLGVSSWFAVSKNDVAQFTPAGYWYIYVSLPIFQFILLRWYFRIAVWYRFLWQVSRLRLQLNSLHPDRAGGLGFLANSIYALEPLLLAHSVLLSGMIFNRIWNANATILDFKVEIMSILIFVLLIPLTPLLFFMFQMVNEKRLGTLRYDVVANLYVNDFREKWITFGKKNNEQLLGTADIQALSDLSNSFDVSNKMRITPIGRNSLLSLVILTALPLLPLVLTIIPLEKIIGQIFGLIF